MFTLLHPKVNMATLNLSNIPNNFSKKFNYYLSVTLQTRKENGEGGLNNQLGIRTIKLSPNVSEQDGTNQRQIAERSAS
jgi:hypothetical protein